MMPIVLAFLGGTNLAAAVNYYARGKDGWAVTALIVSIALVWRATSLA